MLEGLPPNNASFVMRLRCDEATAVTVADIIVETHDPAETAAAAFEESPNETKNWDALPWLVEVYFAYEPDQDWIRELVATAAGQAAAEAIEFDTISQKDWVASSLEGLAPVRAGRFLVHGSHDRDKVRPNDIALEIEAALAFGTGHHGTTRGCLLMLDAVLKQRRPRNVLDVGTGTGVLALAAARYLRAKVAAGDIDPISVEATLSNARLNGATPWIRPVVARGTQHPDLRKGGPYDLIFANILSKPLRMLAPEIARLCETGGELILSGLLYRDVPGVLSAYAAQGFALKRKLHLEGWATLLMARGGAAPRPWSPPYV
jgi:ribosomal protein L11 methyltransferase